MPHELECLNPFELSMISIYNCITRLKVLRNKKGSFQHHLKHLTTFTIVNDFATVNHQLPNLLSKDDIALFRHRSDKGHKDYVFSPFKVHRALIWLKQNNHLYKDVELVWHAGYKWDDENELIDLPFIEITDEEVEKLDAEEGKQNINAELGITELQQEQHAYLMTPDDIQTHEETIKEVIKSKLKYIIEKKRSEYSFVAPYENPEYFWAKCFPQLYPYGLGCPGDPKCSLNNIDKYAKHVLQRCGGPNGRRFQECPSFYFGALHYMIRKKVKGIAYMAQNSSYDTTTGPREELSVGALNQIYDMLKNNIQINDEVIASVSSTEQASNGTLPNSSSASSSSSSSSAENMNNAPPSTDNVPTMNNAPSSTDNVPTMSKEELKWYLKRLSVYSKNLKGTSLYMQNERCKLMAMLASPAIVSEGTWRWFLTLTPNDIYDSRLYEILAADYNNKLTWSADDFRKRRVIVKSMSLEDRKVLLSKSPALVARLFEIKIKCIFDNILLGKDQPLGEIIDYFRRTEFQLRGSPHAHCLLCILRDGINEDYIHSKDPEQQQKLLDLVSKVVTALLAEDPSTKNSDHETDESVRSITTTCNCKIITLIYL